MATFEGRIFELCFSIIFVYSALNCVQATKTRHPHDPEVLRWDNEVISRRIDAFSKHEAKIRALEERVKLLEEQSLKVKDKKCTCEQEKEKDVLRKENVSKRIENNNGNQVNRNVPFEITGSIRLSAFSSILSRDLHKTGLAQTIVFDHVITNTDSGYNQHTGIFTAPSTGVFAFSWTINCEVINGHFQLMRNSDVVSCITADLISTERGTASATMVLQLQRNDVVFIRTDHMFGMTNIVSNTVMRSSFSGWQIL